MCRPIHKDLQKELHKLWSEEDEKNIQGEVVDIISHEEGLDNARSGQAVQVWDN